MTPQSHYDHEGLQLVPNQVLPSQSSSSLAIAYEPVQPIEPDVYFELGFPDKASERTVVERRICGVKRRTFWILMAVAIVAIVAAAVGGGVGSMVAARKAEESRTALNTNTSVPADQATTTTAPLTTSTPHSTLTQTSTRTSTQTKTTTSSAPSATDRAGCPDVDHTIYQSSTGIKYQKLCRTDINGVNNAPIDIEAWFESSFENCIDHCATYNKANKQPPCKAVAWVLVPGDTFTGCYLKNSTGVPNPRTDPQQNVVSAVIVS